MLVNDPRYSRIGLGVPGLILIILGILWYFNLLVYGGIISLIILGMALFVKGFGIDRKLIALRVPEPLEQVRILAALAGIGMITIGIYFGGSYIARHEMLPYPLTLQALVGQLPYLLGVFTQQSIDLFALGVSTYLIGSAIFFYFKRDARMWRMIEGVIVSIWAREIGTRAAVMLVEPHSPELPLVASVLLGIAVSTLAIFLVSALSRRFSDYFITGEQT
jgi:putative membrane protein